MSASLFESSAHSISCCMALPRRATASRAPSIHALLHRATMAKHLAIIQRE
jgi:hypothetical protein